MTIAQALLCMEYLAVDRDCCPAEPSVVLHPGCLSLK
jgi:hypothetical protein